MQLDSLKQKLEDITENVDYFIYSNPRILTNILIGVIAISLSVAHTRIYQLQNQINQIEQRQHD